MRSIDGVNLVRVRTSIPVVKATTNKQDVQVKLDTEVSEPTILSTREQNARLVFYAAIKPTPTKQAAHTISRKRTHTIPISTEKSIAEEMKKLLETESSVQDDIHEEAQNDSVTHELPLFSQQLECPQAEQLYTTRFARIHRSSKVVLKAKNEAVDKVISARTTVSKFVKTINHKLHSV